MPFRMLATASARQAAIVTLIACASSIPGLSAAQETQVPRLRASPGAAAIVIDGRLDEPEWAAADTADGFLQTDPAEGMPASARTVVRVLASTQAVVVGIVCDDPEPDRIVSFSVRRDAPLNSEDHVRIVI